MSLKSFFNNKKSPKVLPISSYEDKSLSQIRLLENKDVDKVQVYSQLQDVQNTIKKQQETNFNNNQILFKNVQPPKNETEEEDYNTYFRARSLLYAKDALPINERGLRKTVKIVSPYI